MKQRYMKGTLCMPSFCSWVLLLCLNLASLNSFANVLIDGIYYSISNGSAWVTFKDWDEQDNPISADYSGNIVIPAFITISGHDFSVVGIYDGAFFRCTKLTSVTIPNSVKGIGDGAFEACSSLTSITIPESVTGIGHGAFYNCTSLTSITIPESVTSIGDKAFDGTPWYNNQPDGIVYAGKVAYTYKGTMPNGIQLALKPNTLGIADYAFSNCFNLMLITIPKSVTNIGEGAFSGCYNMFSFTIPESVTRIGDYAFSGCSGLTSITIPESVTDIGYRAFSSLTSVTLNSDAFVSKERSIDDSMNEIFGDMVETYVIGDAVHCVGSCAFLNCKKITSITLGNNITSINRSAFAGCSGLTSITIPESVTSIGDYGFSNCSGLTSITIPNGVTSIGNYAFRDCSGLISVKVEQKIPINISSGCFSNRTNAMLYVPFGCKAAYEAADYWNEFKEIVEMEPEVPDITFADANVKAICVANWDTNGDGELSYAEAAAVTSIGTVFKENTSITSFDELQYFTGLTSIGYGTFQYCSSLTSITIPNSVTSISESAFSGCQGLTSITIPNSVISIGDNAFYNCISLTSIEVEEGNPNYDSRDDCNAIIKTSSNTLIIGCKSSSIPNSVTSIANYAFFGHDGLTSVTIPNSVTSIGESSFWGCSGLTSVTIGNSVTSIGYGAFQNCISLTNVYCYAENVPQTSKLAFRDSNIGNATLHVPSGTIEAYRITEPWSSFGSIIGPEHIITYMIDGSEYKSYSICEGESVTPEPVPTKEGYTFSGWSEIPETMPAHDVTVTGTFTLDVDTDISTLDNVVYIDNNNLKGYVGQELNLSFRMKNSASIRGFQFDLYLPKGVTAVKSPKGRIQGSLSSGRLPEDDEHTLTLQEQPDGAIRFLCGSQYDETFTGNEGEIATLTVSISEDMIDGEYSVILKNMRLSESDISKFYDTQLVKSTLTILSYILGDINGDGVINVSDYIGIANHILGSTPTGFIEKAADVNEDNTINVSDYIGVANIILTGSPYGNSSNVKPATSKAMGANPSELKNVIYVEPLAVDAGTQSTLSFMMKNTAAIRGFQFDLYLPEGVTVVKNAKGRIQGSLSSGRLPEDDEHTLTIQEQPDGAIRFLCGSQYDETFTGNVGEIATLQVNIADGLASGDYPIVLRNMRLSETDISKFYDSDNVETTLTVKSGEKCATPTIAYANGKLKFICETEGVQFASTITDDDIKSYDSEEIDLVVTYTITVYATKDGCDNSDLATATLCWIDAEPKSEGLDEDAVMEVKALPILIQTQGGTFTIQGATEGTSIAIYSVDGKQYGSAIAEKDSTTIFTTLQPGSVAVVKIGEKAVKVLVK